MTLFLHIHTYVSTTSIYRVMYRVKFAACFACTQVYWVSTSFQDGWVENPQLKLMSPHREPSPVHYLTKSPVSAAYLRGRDVACARENLFSDNRRVKSWCVNSVIPVFCESLFLSLYSRFLDLSLIRDPLANKSVITLVFGAWMWKFENL
jgi:hypothetical protein